MENIGAFQVCRLYAWKTPIYLFRSNTGWKSLFHIKNHGWKAATDKKNGDLNNKSSSFLSILLNNKGTFYTKQVIISFIFISTSTCWFDTQFMRAKSLIIKKEKCFHNSSWLPAPLSFIWQRFHFIVRLKLSLWEVGYGAEYLSGIQCWKIQIAKFSALFRMRNDFLSLWVKQASCSK